MTDLHLPWLELTILLPLLGAGFIFRIKDPHVARKWSLVISGFALIFAIGAWQDFQALDVREGEDPIHLVRWLCGCDVLVIDHLSAPLLPLTALLYFLTTLATLRTKIRRFSFAWSLISESILLATFTCNTPWVVIGLLALGAIPPWIELRARGKPTRVYVLHMGLFVALLVLGQAFVQSEGDHHAHALWAVLPLLVAILIRNGIAPFHCWMTDLFEHATFGTALLYTTPLVGAYAAVRLVLPIATQDALWCMGVASLVTAVYAAGMALVQREARRFFCYLFLSHSALVLIGLEMVDVMGLTGGLCLWVSIGLSLGGFGLTLRALEARRGRLSLADFQGLYEHTPSLAACFALTGLASVGFPGTLGFVATELLVDGVVLTYPYVGVAVVLAGALNGIAVVHAYFMLFTGTRHASTVSLQIGARERFAVLTLATLILVGGIVPQSRILSGHKAAEELLEKRAAVGHLPKALVKAPVAHDSAPVVVKHPAAVRMQPATTN